jgi:hypothetical protein
MAGGDLHIRVGASYGAAGIQKVIDASSGENADLGLTSPVTIGGRRVFVRPEAQALIEQQYQNPALGTSIQLSVHSDTRSERCGFLWLNTRTVDNLPERNDARGQKWPEEYVGNK